MEGDREHCLAAGMDSYVSKPISPPDLLRVLQQIEASMPAGLGKTLDAREMSVLDEGDLLARLNGDTQLLNEVLELFLQQLPTMLANLRKAVSSNDPEEVRMAAHALKGSAANISAVSVSAA